MVALANTEPETAALQAATAPTIDILIEGAYIGRDGFTMTHDGGDTILQALHNATSTRPDTGDWVNMQVLVNGVVTGWQAGVEGDRARLSFTRTLFNGARLTAGQTVDFTPGYKIEFFFWPEHVRFQEGDEITVLHVPSGTTLLTHEVQEEPEVQFEPTHTILHIGDLQGHIDPHMARIATIINDIRAQQPNTIVVDAGDTLHGAPIANHFEGEPVIKAMNAIGFDAMVVGNHDFNFGSETLLERDGEAIFPLLGGNIVYEATGESFLPGYTIVESGGLSVGIVGLTREGTPEVTHARNIIGLDFLNVAQTADEIITEIEDRTDVIIMLAHMGRDEELSALDAVSGKVIASISADTHVTTVEVIDGVILADSGQHGQVVGRLDLVIENNVVVGHRHTFIPVDASVINDTHVEDIIAPYRDEINEIMNEEIGTSLIVLDRSGTETNLGNLVADAMLASSGADIAIQNAGGIRAIIDAGHITVGEVTTALPFENFIVRIDVTGAELIEILEHGVSMYPNVHGRYPVVAGVEFTFNPTQPAGERIVDVMIAGEPIDRNRTYTLATNCFLAGGGDGYAMFVGKTAEDTEVLLREAVIEYIREIETVGTRVDGRIQKTDELPVQPDTEQRNVIFIHPDGTTQAQFTAARLLRHGVDGMLNWDRMPHVAFPRIHVNDSLQAGSVAGAVAHATGYRTNFDVYGLDRQGRPLTTLMEEADIAGFSIGIINSGSITEPGSGAFVAQVEDRGENEAIALQIFEQRPDVILGGGEQWFLPTGVTGRHGAGRRRDGRNLIDEARALGYTVVYTEAELAAIVPGTRKVLGLFAANNIFNDQPESVLRERGLPLYREGAPTLAEMTEAAIEILSTNRKGFFLVVEEEGTDNFGNVNNAEGTIEATLRADDALGVAMDFADTNDDTLVLTSSDSDAGGFSVMGGMREWMPAGQPLPERFDGGTGVPAGGPIDGVGGTRGIPFVTPEGFTFGITWASRHDKADGTFIRAYGLNAEYVSGTIDNIDIHQIFEGTLFNKEINLDKETPVVPVGNQRNVIFIHPDGTTQAQFTAARLLRHGVDGMLNWDRMPHVAFPRIHVNDSLQPGSVAGAVAHATGYRTNFDVYGLDRDGRPLSTLMEEADAAGFSIGIINSGSITEPGSGAFVAQVEDRGEHEAIILQILEQRPDVILGGGEMGFLPAGVQGRHGAGGRTDGRNLIEEAKALGYTIVYNAAELKLAKGDPDTRKVLGLFAAAHIFNDRPESVLRERGLPLYREGAPTLAEMTEAAIEILSRNQKGFFLVVEEEGTDNFGNVNNAEGTIEATLRADDALGAAMEFADINDNTLVLTSSDSDAGGFSIMGGMREQAPAGQPLPERGDARTGVPEGGPIDGVGGTRGIPFVTPEGFTFGIAWASRHDKADSTFVRAYGLNAEYVSGTIDNIDLYTIMRNALGVENVRPRVPQLTLNKGWNLISTPIVLDENRDSLFEVLYGLDWEVAYGFCGDSQKWLLLNKESIINPIDAIFISMLEEGKAEMLPYEGLTAPPAKELFGGWNLISLASLTSMRLDRALISVHDFERKIGRAAKVISPAFNSEQWNFTRIDTDIPKMHPFEGYWLFMDGEETLAGFTTTPLD